jgi:AraC-like DNA-binding protein
VSGRSAATFGGASFGPTHYARYEDDRLRADIAVRVQPRALRGHVTACWGFAEDGLDHLVRRHVPDATAMLFIGFGPTPSMTRADHPQAFQPLPHVVMAGPRTRALLTRSVPGMRFVMIELSPVAAFTLLGGPLQEIRERWVDVAELNRKSLGRLPEQLSQAGSWSERFDLVEETLWSTLSTGPRPDPIVVNAWRRLADGGPVGVERLAEDLGCSRRHLTRRFQQTVGVPPKTTARLLRLRRALRELRADSGRALADVALSSGYADQSHLNRDFRTFVGTTPTTFLAESSSNRRRWAAGYRDTNAEGFRPASISGIDVDFRAEGVDLGPDATSRSLVLPHPIVATP